MINSSFTLCGDKLVLYGGFHKYTDEVNNSVMVLDMKTATWTTIPQTFPRPRFGHSAVAKDEKLYIFGGEDEEGFCNSFYEYSLNEDQWVDKQQTSSESMDHQAEPQGALRVEPRSRHAACLAEDGSRMYISGGITIVEEDGVSDKQVHNDLYWYDFDSEEWGPRLDFVQRFDHTITTHNNKVWAFGGFSAEIVRVDQVAWLNLDTFSIGTVQITHSIPAAISTDLRQGNHFYGPGSAGTVINATTPALLPVRSSISRLDLDSLNVTYLARDCAEMFEGFEWFHMAVIHSHLVFVGRELEGDDEERITHILSVDLSEMGYIDHTGPESPLHDGSSPSTTAAGDSTSFGDQLVGQPSSVGGDLYRFYLSGELCDFELTAIDPATNTVSSPIKVHKMVLAARWPHFRRVLASGMSEAHTGRMHIAEPLPWVQKLIEFMYRDTIEGCSTDQATGLLVLSNMYELGRLRKQCLELIAIKGITMDDCLIIWERAWIANEPLLRRNAALFILNNWGHIVRSPQFAALSKNSIIELAMEAGPKAVVHSPNNKPGYDSESDHWDDDDPMDH